MLPIKLEGSASGLELGQVGLLVVAAEHLGVGALDDHHIDGGQRGIVALHHVAAEHIAVLVAHGAVEVDVGAAIFLADHAGAGQELNGAALLEHVAVAGLHLGVRLGDQIHIAGRGEAAEAGHVGVLDVVLGADGLDSFQKVGAGQNAGGNKLTNLAGGALKTDFTHDFLPPVKND